MWWALFRIFMVCTCFGTGIVCYRALFSVLLSLDMRRDVQEVFKNTPHEKQVMMFSATLPKEIRPVCKKFMNNVIHHLPDSSLAAA